MFARGSSNNKVAKGIVDKCPLTTKMSQAFGELWGYGFMRERWDMVHARTHYGLTIASVVLCVAAFVVFAAIAFNWV
jgi:hypothetical protein